LAVSWLRHRVGIMIHAVMNFWTVGAELFKQSDDLGGFLLTEDRQIERQHIAPVVQLILVLWAARIKTTINRAASVIAPCSHWKGGRSMGERSNAGASALKADRHRLSNNESDEVCNPSHRADFLGCFHPVFGLKPPYRADSLVDLIGGGQSVVSDSSLILAPILNRDEMDLNAARA
jgi:hypothetical protein